MVVKVQLEEIFGGQVVKCLICNELGKSKHLGLELVAPRVMFDEQQTDFVICIECLQKEKETIRLDLLRKAEELEEEAQEMRLLAAQGIDLPSYEELEKREHQINLEEPCSYLEVNKKASQAHVHWDNGIPKIKVKTLDGVWQTLEEKEAQELLDI